MGIQNTASIQKIKKKTVYETTDMHKHDDLGEAIEAQLRIDFATEIPVFDDIWDVVNFIQLNGERIKRFLAEVESAKQK